MIVLINKERVKIRTLLKTKRQNKGLTQAEVAKYLGIATNSYQAIELGIRQGSIAVWDKLEDLFEIPQRQLRETSPSEITQQNNSTKE